MRRALVSLAASLCLAGCAEYRVVEIDFSPPRVFGPQRSEWSGKLQIVQETGGGFFGPSGWQVKRIKLPATDGRCAEVDVEGWREIPIASIEMSDGAGVVVMGAQAFTSWVFGNPYEAIEATRLGTTQPASQPVDWPGQLRTAAEWMTIAPGFAEEVTVEYRIPKQGLWVTLRGSPHASAPDVLEVRDSQGRVLNRFQREELEVRELPAETKGE